MQVYSPIHHLTFQSLNKLAVKRDDLIDTYVSGNKWRKLKYVLAMIIQLQKKHIVTFGGAYSNHLVATAAAAARNGLRSTAFVRGEKVSNEMLLICQLFGMELIFVDRTSYQHKQQLFDTHFGTDTNAFFLAEGGAGEEAVQGCAEIIEELPEIYDHIFVAAGTGTTAAGLLRGINRHDYPTQLHVIPVLKGGEFITDEITKYESNIKQLQLHTAYHFGGYAKTTPPLLDFMQAFIAKTGMLIDPVYTAKMFFAIDDLAKQHYFKKDARILAVHTGGLLGIFGMKEKFNG